MLCGFFLGVALAACSPPDHAIVAEVYYDAIGDDTGQEFVELFNPTSHAVALSGARLEAGDGAGPGRWTLRWTGTASDTIAPGARFVIGGSLVTPAPNALVTLALQNGPDAVRLVWPDGAIEVVGYGALGDAEYFCGAPAVDVVSGFSLSRVPDASEAGSNAADFRAATPSPGRANQARRNLALVRGSIALAPEQPLPGDAIVASASFTDTGADTLRIADVAFAAEVEDLDGPAASRSLSLHSPAAASRLARITRLHPLRASAHLPVIGPQFVFPGDTLGFDLTLDPVAAGRHRLWISATISGDENPADDRDSLRFRVGPGPLAITEIQFHPAEGEGEWVEVRNRSTDAIDLSSFTISDRGAGRGTPADGAGALLPDSLAVLAQDRDALLAAYPGLDATRVWRASPWSALNNSDDASGIADEVVLRESDGLVSDRVAYDASGIPAGVPLELRDGEWLAALDPRGTPLALPAAPPPAARRFDLAPARVAATDARIALTWALPWPRATVRADLYDLDGRRVAELLPARSVAGRGTRDLTLAGTRAGLYWVVLDARATGGDRVTESRPLRVVGLAK